MSRFLYLDFLRSVIKLSNKILTSLILLKFHHSAEELAEVLCRCIKIQTSLKSAKELIEVSLQNHRELMNYFYKLCALNKMQRTHPV